MIENRNYDLRLVNLIEQLVDKISDDDMQKYLYAKINEIKKPKDYETILNETIKDGTINDDALLSALKESFMFQKDEFLMDLKDILLKSLKSSNEIDTEKFSDERKKFYRKVFNGDSVSKQEYIWNFLDIVKDMLVNEIIEITYSSASNKNRYLNFNNQKIIVYNNTHIIPFAIFEQIANLLPSTISSAMSNYYMFLSGDEVSFSDKEGKKYSFLIDNIHILGLKDDINVLMNYFEKNQLDSVVVLDSFDCPKYTKIFDGKIDILLGELSNEENNSLDVRIKCLNNVQGIITDYMTTDSVEQKIELLVYYYHLKNGDVSRVNNDFKERLLGIEVTKLDTILEENAYCFGQKFIKEFKTNKRHEYFNKFCSMYNVESKRNEIVNKYTNIFKVQEYLDYKYKDMSKEIISLLKNRTLTKDQVKSYFTDSINTNSFTYGSDSSFKDSLGHIYKIKFIDDFNYDVFVDSVKLCRVKLNSKSMEIDELLEVNADYKIESSSKRRLKIRKSADYNEILSVNFGTNEVTVNKKNKKMNIFSLADIYIRANLKQIKEGFAIDLCSVLSLINLFKIYDKCLYLNNFNFSVDISNIFVTDMQNRAEMGIICEMSALNDALYALFDYMDRDNSTHFISIQDAESLMLLSSVVSLLPNVIDFDGKERKSIFGFCEKDNDGRYKNVITQTHSDFRKKELNLEQFISGLKDGSIIFRYATSGIVDRTYDSFNPITDVNDMNLLDLIKKNLSGCSNALLWLENINYEQLEEFMGIPEFSIISDKEIFDEIRILLYRNVMNNVLDIVDRIDSELLYQDMLTNLNTFRVSGDSSLLDQLKLYLSSNVKSFSLNELNLCLTKEEKADYIQQLLKTELRMYLLPSQIDECKLIRKQLLEFVNTYSLNNIDSIVNMNSFDKTTFEFIRTMNDDELRQFIENIRLRYPSYLIDFMYYKFIDYSDAELEIRSNVSKVKDAVYNRKFFDVKLYSKDKINSMVSLKDSQRAELIYLEDKIVVYENYIRFSKNTDVSIEKMFQLHLEQFGFLKQKKYLLSIKKLEMDEKVNEKGVVANVKKIIDDPSVRKEKIENEIRFLDAQFDYYSSVIKLYDILNKIINSNSSDISVELINELFLLGEFYKYLSSSIKNSIKMKINELLENDELDVNLKSALKSVELRISCEGDIKGYFDNILKSLYSHKLKLSKNNEKFVDESIFSFSQLEFQKSCFSYHQKELDNELLMNLSSMYQYISVVFEQYPKYRKEFLADIEKRVAFLYSDYPKFKYKDLFTLIVGEIGEDLKLNNSRIYNKIRMKLGKTLDSVASSDEMFTFLSNCLREDISECEKLFNESCKRANLLLDSKYYMIDGETEKHVKERLLTIIPEIKIIDTYIDCVMSSLSRKLNDLSNNYSWYSAGTEYNYSKSPDGLYAEGGRVDYIIRDLISSYLATLYQLLLLKREDGTPIIEDERKIDYYWAVIKERCIEILRKNSFYSNMIVSFINSEELTSVRVGGR